MNASKEPNWCTSLRYVALPLVLAFSDCSYAEWLTRVATPNGTGKIALATEPVQHFLEFGHHAYAPDAYFGLNGENLSDQLSLGEPIPISLFQGLSARKVVFSDALAEHEVQVTKTAHRDSFWDQIIAVSAEVVSAAPRYEMIEAGDAGSALPPHVRELQMSAKQIQSQQESLVDPPHYPRDEAHTVMDRTGIDCVSSRFSEGARGQRQ